MRSRLAKIIEVMAVVALAFLINSCGAQKYCPTCGTTVNGAYTVLDVVPVPEHNPTGEPGGPFNSFDISWFDPTQQKMYVSDRIGLDIVVVDAKNNFAVNTVGGLNQVANAGNNASPCWGPQLDPADVQGIPSIVTGLGQVDPTRPGNGLTRFGCRNAPYFANFGNAFPGFGPNGMFGGFPGAQCCAARANGVNPISGPDGLLVTPDGKTLVVGSGSASLVIFDLTSNPATVLAAFSTGASPDFDGPAGVAPCIQTWNGGAGSDPTCADDRADEMGFGTVGGHDIVAVANGDPGLPFVTLVDITDIDNRKFTPPFTTPGQGHCLPVNYPAYPANGDATNNYTSANPPACILGQIYYDAVSPQDSTVAVDSAGGACPDPSTLVPSGASGGPFPLVATGGTITIPCHHAPVVDANTGFFITNNGSAGAGQQAEFAVAGTGAIAFNPLHGTFYLENLNCTASTLATQSSVAVGCIDEIDPRIGNPAGPVVINVVPVYNCMPAGIVQGPGHDFFVGCGGHDGVQFPPLLIIFDGTCTSSATCLASEVKIDQSGGTDEVWYNPGDNRYYTAGRDMPNGPVMGVVDAATRRWLVNVPTGSNSHSITVNQFTNQIFVPLQAGPRCGTQSGNGCIGVYGRQ
ncbi:MAG: hypothetical protein WBL63_08765 [Candidatus Acidiferrum sp.]